MQNVSDVDAFVIIVPFFAAIVGLIIWLGTLVPKGHHKIWGR